MIVESLLEAYYFSECNLKPSFVLINSINKEKNQPDETKSVPRSERFAETFAFGDAYVMDCIVSVAVTA